jgi:transcriptional regulator with XRE-family HTH domain
MAAHRVELGPVLRERRTALGVTQADLADAVGVSATTLRRWESGAAMPEPAAIADMREALHLSDAEVELWQSWCAPAPRSEDGEDPAGSAAAAEGRGDRAAGDSTGSETDGAAAATAADATAATSPSAAARAEGARRRARVRREIDERRRRRAGRRAGRSRVSGTRSAGPAPLPSLPGARGGGEETDPAERRRYRLRAVGLLVVLGLLVAVLLWAVVELGDGIGAVIDLFRDEAPSTTVADAAAASLWPSAGPLPGNG